MPDVTTVMFSINGVIQPLAVHEGDRILVDFSHLAPTTPAGGRLATVAICTGDETTVICYSSVHQISRKRTRDV